MSIPNPELMDRLSAGKRAAVGQKEMRSLTKRNFANLPENKKKLDEETRRKEIADRKAASL